MYKIQSYPSEGCALRRRICGPHPNCGSTSPHYRPNPQSLHAKPRHVSWRLVVHALYARRSFCGAIPEVVLEWGPTSKRAPNCMGPNCLSFLIGWCVWVMCAWSAYWFIGVWRWKGFYFFKKMWAWICPVTVLPGPMTIAWTAVIIQSCSSRILWTVGSIHWAIQDPDRRKSPNNKRWLLIFFLLYIYNYLFL